MTSAKMENEVKQETTVDVNDIGTAYKEEAEDAGGEIVRKCFIC